MCPTNGVGPRYPLVHHIPLAKKGGMVLLKADLIQDVRLSGARRALKDRAIWPQLIDIAGAPNEPFIPSSHLKTMTPRPSPMIRLSMMIPRGSIISMTGKRRAKALQTVWSRTCLMIRTINNLLHTSRSTLVPLLRQVSGTVGSQHGMTRKHDIPVDLIGPSFRAMTGLFSRTTYTSPDQITSHGPGRIATQGGISIVSRSD